MSIPSSTTRTYGSHVPNGGDQVAAAVDSAAKSAQHTVDGVLDSLSGTVESIRSQASPVIDRLSAQAESAAKRSIGAVRETSQQLRDRAIRANDSTVAYVKEEPVKAVLIAAAAGAFLMGLVSLLSRSRKA